MSSQERVSGQSTILVQRPGGYYRDRFGAYKLYLDDKLVGNIRQGKNLSIVTGPGRHTLYAKVSWTGSPVLQLDLRPDERVEVQVAPAGSAFQLNQLLGTDKYLTLSRT